MQGIIANLASLGRQKLTILAGAALAMVTVLVLGLSTMSRPDYAPIYSDLSITSANAIEAALANAGLNVTMSEDGSSVLVPRSDTARARMILAESGVSIDGDPGWELFDEQGGLAMNSFLQKINRTRAMEGELARSIQTLDGISTARVHLVLPDREPFSRETPTPRASIILRPEPGRAVNRKQATAVRNLVAAAVAELDLSRVTVLSANGETILAEGPGGDSPATMQSAKSSIEDRLSRDIENILTARVGAGNARVRVNVELTTQREVIVEESFDPEQQVVRSTETTSENQTGQEGGGNVGVENNIPAALAGEDEGGATNSRSEANEVVQYEIGTTRREIVREAGDVRRMTVAVLVNGIYNVVGSDVAYSERTPEELDRLAQLVKSAVGFSEVRGDSVSVDSMRFMDYSMDLGEPLEISAMQRLGESIVPLLRGVLALLIVAVVMVLGVRPLLRKLEPAEALPEPDENNLTAITSDVAPSIEQSAGSELANQFGQQPSGSEKLDTRDSQALIEPAFETEMPQFITKQGIRGSLHKRKIDKIQELAGESPDEVLRVLRSWLKEEEPA